MTKNDERQVWKAMMKFASDKPLTEQEWVNLSWLSLIDRNNLCFEPKNVRWAATDTEHADNLKFYRSLCPAVH